MEVMMAGVHSLRRILILMLILTLGATEPGCRKPVPPVADSDWRTHLSQPDRLERDWVLPDNTMLAEVAQPAAWPAATVPSYAYEIYDPQTDTATTVVAGDYLAYVQSISEQAVEFIAGNFTGARYLLRYDLAKHRLNQYPMWYSANEPRQFGLTNTYESWRGVSFTSAWIDLMPSGYPCPIPYFIVRPKAEQDELWIEYPGMAAKSAQLGPLVAADMPPPVSGASVVDGVAGEGGRRLPGITLCLRLKSPDWSKLTFGVLGPRRGTTANRLILFLSQTDSPTDQTSALGMPRLWDEWKQWSARPCTLTESMPVTRSWPLDDGLVLVEWAPNAFDTMYGLCDPEAQLIALLVGGADAAVPLSIAPDRVVLLGDESGVSAYSSWPYLIVMDPATRTIERQEVSVSVKQGVAYGGATSLLQSVISEGDGLRMRFMSGPIVAGGGGAPRITFRPIPAANQLLVQFHNSPVFSDYPAHESVTLGPIDITGVPFVTTAVLEAGIAGVDGEREPGVTLRLTLAADRWEALTYRLTGRDLPANAPPNGNEGSMVLLFSDQEKAIDISAIYNRVR